ncbi:sulfite exporter TauE/SafE family protein [Saccharospirillum impatiens]|uniref:sulfite exporter TauE/SafE family protein n=1 Tax=Saccharospirillum impatiens TaxID=169438 RepID=UPI00040915F0|nr:sulfite exporter TauE/SafE family protein [Saccharospirillum impatiens]
MLALLSQWMPDSLNNLAFWSLVLVSYMTSAITAALGIGGGVTLLAIMANLLPASAVIPLHGVVQFGSNLGRLTTLFRFVDWRLVLWFSIGSLIGSVIGAGASTQMPAAGLQIAMGVFILYTAWLPPITLPTGKKFISMLGGVTSFISMIVGGVAPLVFAAIKPMFTERTALVGTMAALISGQQLLKVVFFGFFGFVFSDWYLMIALMLFTGYLGTLTGRVFLERLSAEQVQPILKVVLTIMAVRLLYLGVIG